MKASTVSVYGVRKLACFVAMLAVGFLSMATSYQGQVHERQLVGRTVLPAESSARGALLSVQSESFVTDVQVSASPGVTLHVVDTDGTLVEATGSLFGFCNINGCEGLELRIVRADLDGDLAVEIVATVFVNDAGRGVAPIVIELQFFD